MISDEQRDFFLIDFGYEDFFNIIGFDFWKFWICWLNIFTPAQLRWYTRSNLVKWTIGKGFLTRIIFSDIVMDNDGPQIPIVGFLVVYGNGAKWGHWAHIGV